MVAVCLGCENNSKEKPVSNTDLADDGGVEIALVNQYCGGCHQPLIPDILDQQTWLKHVLPAMAIRLGIGVYAGEYVNDPANTTKAISFENWTKIVEYYKRSAPKNIVPAKPPSPLKQSWSIFELKKPKPISSAVANTVMTVIDPANSMIYTSDSKNNKLLQWDKKLRPTLFSTLPSPAVNGHFITDQEGKQQGIFTCIGNLMVNDLSEGKLLQYSLADQSGQLPGTIAASLPRPVQSIPSDMNKDGLTDWLVCSFGHNTGGLFCFEQLQDGRFEKKIISALPGVSQAVSGDYNNDGWPDIIALFAHAEESIRLFLNDRKGGFTMTTLISFLPVNGSTSFQLTDFNEDGLIDILSLLTDKK